MQITDRRRFWMRNKPYQLVRFVVLNLKILKAVNRNKRA
jgi:hypothetical protein